MALITRYIGQRLLRLSLLVLVAMMALATPATQAAPAAQGVRDTPALQALLARAQANGGARVIVRLNAPFSADAERGTADAERGQRALPEAARQQREGIQRAQDALLQRLAGHKLDGLQRFELIPYLALSADAPTLAALAADPGVADIQEDGLVAFTGAGENILKIGGNPQGTWGTSDIAGAGSNVAILDSGVMKTHQFLLDANGKSRVVAEACYSANDASLHASSVCPGGSTASTASGSGVNCPVTTYFCDHGTAVAGIAAGRSFSNQEFGPFPGVARDANIVAIQVASKIDSQNTCMAMLATSPCAVPLRSNVLAGLQQVYWLATHTMNIAAVNLSIGEGLFSGTCDSDAKWASIRDQIVVLRNAGIATIVAAGNESSKTSIAAPACLSSAIAVSATDLDDVVEDKSNISPQVDLLAPGKDIYSAMVTTSGATNASGIYDGTSMATPHVTGAWAVLKQRLGQSASVDTVLQRLQNTGLYLADTRGSSTQKYPRIRLGAAVDFDSTCGDPFDLWGSDLTFNDNDWRGAADEVVVNDPAKTHYFCSSVDEDWISFNASADVTYQVETFALSQLNDTKLELYHDTDPIPLAVSDDTDTGTYGSKLIFTPSQLGTYYVRVRPAASGIGGSTAFAYSLRVRSLANNCPDADDDTMAKALLFTVNSSSSRGLCGGDDQDWVKFQVAKPKTTLRLETLNLGLGQSFDGIWNPTDTVLELYGTDGTTQLKNNDDVTGGVLRSLIEYTFDVSGTYYLKVRPFSSGGMGESYDLRLTRIDKISNVTTANSILSGAETQPAKKAPLPAPEPAPGAGGRPGKPGGKLAPTCPEDTFEGAGDGNDTAAAADPITVGAQAQLQRFCSQTDEDWVKFDASANKTYQVETSDLSPNNDTRLAIYSNPSQAAVASNDDSDAGGYGSKVLFTPTAAGTYYVRLRPVAGVGGDASFTYNLRVLDLGNPCSFNEPDNVGTQNKPFTIGQTESRGLCTSGDQDWVRFRITKANTTLRIETINLGVGQDSNGTWHNTDTVLELYSTNGSTLLKSDDDVDTSAGRFRSMIEYTFSNAGTYYVKVRDFSNLGGPGQTYDLRITRFDPLAPSSSAGTLPGAPTKPLK